MKTIYVDSPKHGKKDILVDDEDYDHLMQWKWCIRKCKGNYIRVRPYFLSTPCFFENVALFVLFFIYLNRCKHFQFYKSNS